MLLRMNKSMTSFFLKNTLFSGAPASPVQEAQVVEDDVVLQTSRPGDESTGGSGGGVQAAPKAQPAKAEKRVGRNDPCPCGSGKKYKNCHGK